MREYYELIRKQQFLDGEKCGLTHMQSPIFSVIRRWLSAIELLMIQKRKMLSRSTYRTSKSSLRRLIKGYTSSSLRSNNRVRLKRNVSLQLTKTRHSSLTVSSKEPNEQESSTMLSELLPSKISRQYFA